MFRLDEAAAREQQESLARIRARRDAVAVAARLEALRSAAADDGADLMGPILDAVRAYATVGEISDAMRQVFGMHREAA